MKNNELSKKISKIEKCFALEKVQISRENQN